MPNTTPNQAAEENDEGADDYELAAADEASRAVPVRKPTVMPAAAVAPPPVSIAEKYPHRRARPVAEAADPHEGDSPVRNLIIPIVLLSLGIGLRVAQLLYANEGQGNRWAGNVATPGGFGKALVLVSFEMVIAAAIMGLGAAASAMTLGVEFGPVGRAALKLSAAAVFAIGVVSWIALFDQDAYSIGGLALALHVMVVLNWITLGFFFKMELQELLLTVAIVTALYAVTIAALWRA
jgi:hypothetical protein